MPRPTLHLLPPQALKIHDTETVAVLLALGLECLRTELDGDRVFFYFESSPEAQGALVKHTSGQLRFDAHTLIEGFRKARRLLADALRAEGRLR